MKMPNGATSLMVAGVAVYAIAAFVPLAIHPYLWTGRTMESDVPWHFMGHDFVAGVSAAVGLLLCILFGAVAARRGGPAMWGCLTPAFLFLSAPIGRGVAVLLHSRRIWAGLPAAESDWRTFAEYAQATVRAQFIALFIAAAVVCGLLLLARNDGRAGARDPR